MKKYIIAFLTTLFFTQAYPQKVIQLIGLECDNSDFSQVSYLVMYDNTNDVAFDKAYIPYQTIAVVRNGDDVKLLRQNYLVVPTAQGFRYVTQSVTEIPNDTTVAEMEFEKNYEYSSSDTKPRFFTDRKAIRDFMLSQKPLFKDAISIDYEKISFVTPNFYITDGFTSLVHGGATWFNAKEISNLYKINPSFAISSNLLTDFLGRKSINQIIIDAVRNVYTDNDIESDDAIDADFQLPWAGSIGNYNDVYFTLAYLNNQVKIIPLTALNGNSARSFLVWGNPFSDKSLLNNLKIKEYGKPTKNNFDFESPDQTTLISLKNDSVYVYNKQDNKLLLEKPLPKFNKIVMSEWALGSFVDNWQTEF